MPPQGRCGNVWRQFLLSQSGVGGAAGIEWPGTLVNRPQSTERLFTTRDSLVPSVISVKAEKLWAGTRFLQGPFRVSTPGTVVKAREIHRP